MFDEELEYFKANQAELVRKHQGKVLAIQGEHILGIYNTLLDAFKETMKSNKPGTFMLQPCEPGPDAYTVTINGLNFSRA